MGYEPTMLPLHYRAMLFGGPTRTWTRNKRLWVFRFYLWTIGPNLLRSLRDSNPSDWTPWQGDIHAKQTQRPIKMRERRDSNPRPIDYLLLLITKTRKIFCCSLDYVITMQINCLGVPSIVCTHLQVHLLDLARRHRTYSKYHIHRISGIFT